jgi:hypothetical protein
MVLSTAYRVYHWGLWEVNRSFEAGSTDSFHGWCQQTVQPCVSFIAVTICSYLAQFKKQRLVWPSPRRR